MFLDKCFEEKESLDISDFTKINEQFSSEMLLSVSFDL
jgi:hypothetical protein